MSMKNKHRECPEAGMVRNYSVIIFTYGEKNFSV